MKNCKFFAFVFLSFIFGTSAFGQITERKRPAQWDNLAFGGRFMDHFLPMQANTPATADTWGAEGVKPRYVNNGIEDPEWSYWGGNILVDEQGKYHLFVARWPENAPKGHMSWPSSEVAHCLADNSFGPYHVVETLGRGHNPEAFQLNDGRFVVYVYKGRYIADNINGPWQRSYFQFEPRDRKIIDGLSNFSFAKREDGSFIAVGRGGGIWVSRTGASPYYQVTEKRVYPPVDGRFEDPVIWKTNIQYHMIVNDWLGRIAYYLRSRDGIHWKVDPGEAYMPGIARHEDGTSEDWFKYERIRMLQDDLGRACQADFAVIDTIKWEDHPNDNHSSKHICIPLTVGRQLTILNHGKIGKKTSEIKVLVKAEKGFDPAKDMDVSSLRFGAPEEVNFGKGSLVRSTEKAENDLIVTFEGAGNGLTDDNFTAKLLGKTTGGQLLFGYARLPGITYLTPALSATMPKIYIKNKQVLVEVEVQNFGQVAAQPAKLIMKKIEEGKENVIASGVIPALKPYEKRTLKIQGAFHLTTGQEINIETTIYPVNQPAERLHGTIKVLD